MILNPQDTPNNIIVELLTKIVQDQGHIMARVLFMDGQVRRMSVLVDRMAKAEGQDIENVETPT